jgi:hypothetical protein
MEHPAHAVYRRSSLPDQKATSCIAGSGRKKIRVSLIRGRNAFREDHRRILEEVRHSLKLYSSGIKDLFDAWNQDKRVNLQTRINVGYNSSVDLRYLASRIHAGFENTDTEATIMITLAVAGLLKDYYRPLSEYLNALGGRTRFAVDKSGTFEWIILKWFLSMFTDEVAKPCHDASGGYIPMNSKIANSAWENLITGILN